MKSNLAQSDKGSHRIAFTMKLLEGFQDEYRRRHDSLWPELRSLLKGAGIREYSINLDESSSVLFALLTVDDPRALDRLAHDPVMQKWWGYMKDIMETRPDGSPVTTPLAEMFYLP